MLLSLPDEILVRILGKLNASDRNARCRLVNHRLNSVIGSSVVLQVLTECELANLMLGTPRQDGLTGVLASLEDRRNAWRTLQSMDELVLPAFSEYEQIRIFGRDCNIICQTNSNELVFTQIPSRTKGIPYKTWTLDCGMDHVDSVAADEQQDLLTVTRVLRDGTDCIDSVEIKLLSLATGAMHTAADAAISLSLPPSYSSTARDASDSPATDTALAGDFIGIMLSILRDGQHDDMICYLWVCNWKTGELKVEAWCGNDGQISNAASFAFLSPESVLIARSNFPVQSVELIVVNIHGPLRRGTFATIADYIFDLPEQKVKEYATCDRIMINKCTSSYPLFDSNSDYTFTHTPASRIISVDLWYTTWKSLNYKCRLIVPISHMLQCLAEAITSRSSTQQLNEGVTISTTGPQPLWHIPWSRWEQEVCWIALPGPWPTMASYSSTSWLAVEPRDDKCWNPDNPDFMGVLVKYDFPSEMQMRRESMLQSRPGSEPSQGPLTLIETKNHYRWTIEADNGDLWASDVPCVPYRQTFFTTDVAPSVYPHDLSYETTEDALLLRDAGAIEPYGPWRVFSI